MSLAIPRTALIALSLAQPYLIASALRFLSLPDDESARNMGYGLIGAFAFVFIGAAVRSVHSLICGAN
jgi:ATP-binding cassette, subfamily C (CFTR/MRP), member 1